MLIQSLAHLGQLFRVVHFDVDSLLEGIDEILHLSTHRLAVLDHFLRVGLSGVGPTTNDLERSGKVDSLLGVGSSSSML